MKDIPGYENLYSITKDGHVLRHPKMIKNSNNIVRFHKGGWLKPLIKSNGYFTVALWKDNHEKRVHIHRLVAQAFLLQEEPSHIVNHKNGIKTDNRIENLEWCSQKENIQHSMRMGLFRNRHVKTSAHARRCATSSSR